MRAVIFDWDLTLWNSWDIHLWLMERTGFDLGIIPPGAEAVAAEFHRPFHQHLLWFFGSTPDSQGELDTIVAAYLHHYHAIVGHRNYLYPGVASLLRGLRRRGIRIGILSDKVPEFGEAELRQSGIADLVEYTSFKTDRRPFKPDPTGLFHVLEGLGVEAADTMYVGEAPQDIACARDAGVRSAAAMWATIDADAIIAQQPTYRLHRPHQVMAVVAEINNYDGGFGGSNPGCATCRGPGDPMRMIRWATRMQPLPHPKRRPMRNPMRAGNTGRWRLAGAGALASCHCHQAWRTRSRRCR